MLAGLSLIVTGTRRVSFQGVDEVRQTHVVRTVGYENCEVVYASDLGAWSVSLTVLGAVKEAVKFRKVPFR